LAPTGQILINHPTVETFIAAIGKDSRAQELGLIFSIIGIHLQDLDDYRLEVWVRRLWADNEAGLQLEFRSAALSSQDHGHGLDDGPWILTDVIFWGWRKETGTSYGGPMPRGLNFPMSRDLVRLQLQTELGDPIVFGFSSNVDVWMLGALELAVDYDGDKGIRCISLALPPDD